MSHRATSQRATSQRATSQRASSQCAFLSTDDLDDFVIYDELTYPAFEALGWSVEAVPWRAKEDWSRFEMVIIRSPWDYQQDAERFLDVLAEIDGATHLFNPLDIVRWNVRKDYLQDLEGRGVPIVPTLFRPEAAPLDGSVFEDLGASKVVVKPLVSGNADHTYVLGLGELEAKKEELESIFATRAHLIQPFMPSVAEEGEYSLFYFAGVLSHAILKTPKSGDFRVQEEHGGQIRAVEVDAAMRGAAEKALAAIGQELLYARVDLLRDEAAPESDRWRLMELELIEPSLYFAYAPGSPERFARAAVDWLR